MQLSLKNSENIMFIKKKIRYWEITTNRANKGDFII